MSELSDQLKALAQAQKKNEDGVLNPIRYRDLKAGQEFFTAPVVTPFDKLMMKEKNGKLIATHSTSTVIYTFSGNTVVYIETLVE